MRSRCWLGPVVAVHRVGHSRCCPCSPLTSRRTSASATARRAFRPPARRGALGQVRGPAHDRHGVCRRHADGAGDSRSRLRRAARAASAPRAASSSAAARSSPVARSVMARSCCSLGVRRVSRTSVSARARSRPPTRARRGRWCSARRPRLGGGGFEALGEQGVLGPLGVEAVLDGQRGALGALGLGSGGADDGGQAAELLGDRRQPGVRPAAVPGGIGVVLGLLGCLGGGGELEPEPFRAWVVAAGGRPVPRRRRP